MEFGALVLLSLVLVAHIFTDPEGRTLLRSGYLKSVRKEGCRDCLSRAESVIDGCLSQSEGRAVAAGCSLRYATYPFFSHKNATDLSKFFPKSLSKEGCRDKDATDLNQSFPKLEFPEFWILIGAFAAAAVLIRFISVLVSVYRGRALMKESVDKMHELI